MRWDDRGFSLEFQLVFHEIREGSMKPPSFSLSMDTHTHVLESNVMAKSVLESAFHRTTGDHRALGRHAPQGSH